MPFPSTLFRLTQRQLDNVPSQQVVMAIDHYDVQLENAVETGGEAHIPGLLAKLRFLIDQYERFRDPNEASPLISHADDDSVEHYMAVDEATATRLRNGTWHGLINNDDEPAVLGGGAYPLPMPTEADRLAALQALEFPPDGTSIDELEELDRIARARGNDDEPDELDAIIVDMEPLDE